MWTFALASAISTVHAQTEQTAGSAEPVRTYTLLREDENWSFLKDPSLRQDPWDRLKYIPLGPDGWFLTIGGEAREIFEQVGNDNWGKQPYINRFFLERYMLHTDWHFGKHVRAFVQLKSGLESFRRGGYRPIDEKKLDFEAGFVEIGAAEGDHWVVLQAGRQELNYGSGRLVSVREGPNVRQSFDGARLKIKAGAWRMDVWAARPDLDKPGFFDNVPDHRTAFWGVYATRPWQRRVSFDTYYLGLDRKSFTYNRGTARETRHNLGVRLWRSPATKESDWDFDYEGVWQFGTFGGGGIRAWTVASDTGYSFPGTRLQPRVSVKADISSGDDPRSGSLGTFSPIFPMGNYFGVLADTGPGPVNFIDLHPRLQTKLPRGVSISTDLVVQWRQSLTDGVYAVPGFLLVPAGGSRARFVGYRPGVEVRWQVDRHLWFQADYGVFFAGEFLKQASPGRNINYMEFWAGYKF
jgi:Alginate export